MKEYCLKISLRLCNSLLLFYHVVLIVISARYLVGVNTTDIGYLLFMVWSYPLLYITQKRLVVALYGSAQIPQTSSLELDKYFLSTYQKPTKLPKCNAKDMFLGRLFPSAFPESKKKVEKSDMIYYKNLGNIIRNKIQTITKLEIFLQLWIYFAFFFGSIVATKYFQINGEMAFQECAIYTSQMLWIVGSLILLSIVFMAMVSNARSALKKSIKIYQNNKENK